MLQWTEYVPGNEDTLPPYEETPFLVYQPMERLDEPPFWVKTGSEINEIVNNENDSGEPFYWAPIPTPEQCGLSS